MTKMDIFCEKKAKMAQFPSIQSLETFGLIELVSSSYFPRKNLFWQLINLMITDIATKKELLQSPLKLTQKLILKIENVLGESRRRRIFHYNKLPDKELLIRIYHCTHTSILIIPKVLLMNYYNAEIDISRSHLLHKISSGFRRY